MKKRMRKNIPPQVRIFMTLLTLAIIIIITSINLKNTFWSSFCSNISAGLFTGLVICLISSSKSAYVSKMEQKRKWLERIHGMIMDYFDLWHKYISNQYEGKNEYDFVYDMGAHANWINEFILQSQFNKENFFDGNKLCKMEFSYDAMDINKAQIELKEWIMDDNWNKKEVIKMFEVVDKQLRNLNNKVVLEIDLIDIKISRCNKSMI